MRHRETEIRTADYNVTNLSFWYGFRIGILAPGAHIAGLSLDAVAARNRRSVQLPVAPPACLLLAHWSRTPHRRWHLPTDLQVLAPARRSVRRVLVLFLSEQLSETNITSQFAPELQQRRRDLLNPPHWEARRK